MRLKTPKTYAAAHWLPLILMVATLSHINICIADSYEAISPAVVNPIDVAIIIDNSIHTAELYSNHHSTTPLTDPQSRLQIAKDAIAQLLMPPGLQGVRISLWQTQHDGAEQMLPLTPLNQWVYHDEQLQNLGHYLNTQISQWSPTGANPMATSYLYALQQLLDKPVTKPSCKVQQGYTDDIYWQTQCASETALTPVSPPLCGHSQRWLLLITTGTISFASGDTAPLSELRSVLQALQTADQQADNPLSICTDSNSPSVIQECLIAAADTLYQTQEIRTLVISIDEDSEHNDNHWLHLLARAGGGSKALPAFLPDTSTAYLREHLQQLIAEYNSPPQNTSDTVVTQHQLTDTNTVITSAISPTNRQVWGGHLWQFSADKSLDYQQLPNQDLWHNKTNQQQSNLIPTNTSRQVFTYIPSYLLEPSSNHSEANTALVTTSLSNPILSANEVHENNAALNHWLQQTFKLTPDNAKSLIGYARGIASDSSHYPPKLLAVDHHILGDSLRKSVTLLEGENPQVFFATNAGFLHAFDRNSGQEQFAFIPGESWLSLYRHWVNANHVGHSYGIDGSLSHWREDDSTDQPPRQYLFFGLGRGGTGHYSLDITDIHQPKLLWRLDNSSTGFEQLGLNWSTLRPLTIAWDNQPRQAVIWAAGYDPRYDTNNHIDKPIGNAIYLVDIHTGEKLWSVGREGTHNLYHNDLDDSIIAPLTLLDLDQDGLIEQFYVADLGGRIWWAPPNASTDALWQDFRPIAQLSDQGIKRPMFHALDASYFNRQGQQTLALSGGTGWHNRPLNNQEQQILFSLNATSLGQDLGYEPWTFQQINNDPNLGWSLLLNNNEWVTGRAYTIAHQTYINSWQRLHDDSCTQAAVTHQVYPFNITDKLDVSSTHNSNSSHGNSADIEPAPILSQEVTASPQPLLWPVSPLAIELNQGELQLLQGNGEMVITKLPDITPTYYWSN